MRGGFKDEIEIGSCRLPHQGTFDVDRTYNIEGLDTGTFYEFRIAAMNEIGLAEYSSPTKACRTRTTIPWPISGRPEVVDIKPNQIKITWLAPHSSGIPLKSFRIQYRGGNVRNWGDAEDTVVTMEAAVANNEEHRKNVSKDQLVHLER